MDKIDNKLINEFEKKFMKIIQNKIIDNAKEDFSDGLETDYIDEYEKKLMEKYGVKDEVKSKNNYKRRAKNKEKVKEEDKNIEKSILEELEELEKEFMGKFEEETDEQVDDKNVKVNPADPATIPKFVDPIKIPKVAKSVIPYDKEKKRPALYKMAAEEIKHRFHRAFPLTKVWGYNGSYLGPTIIAYKGIPIRVKWINNLPDKHFLPVDKSIHGLEKLPEVRTVVHLHGANVKDDSDGHPEAWYTRNYKEVGPTFTRKIYEYPNSQNSGTLWYHDHAMGITRLNVYAGLAGMYLLRDRLEKKLNLPSGKYEIPLIIQDKSFNEDGSLFYPDNSTPPVDFPKPSTASFFFGNTIVVNGNLWPYFDVEPRKYRFRMLNASNTRGYTFKLSNGESFIQIGTELGLLDKPIKIDSFDLEPGERIDFIIDFSKYKNKKITLLNDALIPNIDAGEDMKFVMEFRVKAPLKDEDTSSIPRKLYPYKKVNPLLAVKQRTLHLDSTTDEYGRVMHLLNDKRWHDPATETPQFGDVEIWHLVNHFDFTHPIHLHLVHFEILGRKSFDEALFDAEGNYKFDFESLTPPLDYEKGRKDIAQAFGKQVTSIVVRFNQRTGNYVWHCHILEHEDYDMMRPLNVIEKPVDIEETEQEKEEEVVYH